MIGRSAVRLGMVAAVAMAVVACLPKVEQPEITLEGARLASVGLSGGVVEVRLSVYNPNGFGLEASGLTYDLDFEDPASDEWIDFTEGRIDERLEVGAGETAEIAVPIEFSFRELGEVMRGLLDRGTFDYRVSGSVDLEEPVERSIPFRHAGQVSPTGFR